MSFSLDDVSPILPDLERRIVDLVEVESFSTDLPALSRCLDLIQGWIAELFGENATMSVKESNIHGDTLIVHLPGTVDTNVLFVGHYDTVWPSGTLAAWGQREYEDEDGRRRLSGPGIFDMKTGVVQMIAIAKLLQDAEATPSITLVINGDEELGSPFSRQFIEAEADKTDAAFVFEASADGKVKTARKAIAILNIEATGVEAHAGLEPHKGASAVDALIEVCTQVKALQDPEKETTVNIGLISGGSASNVVAAKARATVDFRYWYPEERPRIEAGIAQITWSDDRADVDFTFDWNRPPLVFTEGSQRLFALMQGQAAALGGDLDNISVGGASDANYISDRGTPVICGLGAVGDGAHARHEFVYPDRFALTVAMLANTIEALASR